MGLLAGIYGDINLGFRQDIGDFKQCRSATLTYDSVKSWKVPKLQRYSPL